MSANIQPGSAIALAEVTNPVEHCHRCSAEIKGEPTIVDDYGDAYCDQDCLDAHEESQNERRYENFCEAFYGGEVETVNEQHQRAWQQKQELRGAR